MAGTYRIFGSELSPYSVKVRSYFRYKTIAHQWEIRSARNHDEFQRYAKLPLIPLVVTPEDKALQDSTPIIEALERRHPAPSIHPPQPALAFLSALIEEYADEWCNKPMFHYRWHYEPDQASAAARIAGSMMPDLDTGALPAAAQQVKERMVPRLRFVGSTPETKDQIEASFLRQLALLERHLAARPFLFGGRPALADFGLYAQLYQCSSDPTPGAIIRRDAPVVLDWIERMLDPRASGEFETWEALAPTLAPLLREEIGAVFFPWTLANARALAAGAATFTAQIGGRPFTQDTQKYHAKSLAALRARYAAVADKGELDAILEESNCLAPLREA